MNPKSCYTLLQCSVQKLCYRVDHVELINWSGISLLMNSHHSNCQIFSHDFLVTTYADHFHTDIYKTIFVNMILSKLEVNKRSKTICT